MGTYSLLLLSLSCSVAVLAAPVSPTSLDGTPATVLHFDGVQGGIGSQGVGEFFLHYELHETIRSRTGDGRKAIPTPPRTLGRQFHTMREAHSIPWGAEGVVGRRTFITNLPYVLGSGSSALGELHLIAILWRADTDDAPWKGALTAVQTDAASTIIGQANVTPIRRNTLPSGNGAVVIHPTDYKVVEYPWGHLTWYVSRELKNSNTMTVGEAVIKPGHENRRHFHPNCDEVMHVIHGRILQSIDDRTIEMQLGDTVSIPAGVKHNAKNIGTQDAVLAISFSSADREVVGE
jgi:quercetin dioxygenase-like cupin family protein